MLIPYRNSRNSQLWLAYEKLHNLSKIDTLRRFSAQPKGRGVREKLFTMGIQ